MFPINYRLPEQMPPHQRDYPLREEVAGTEPIGESRIILLVFVGYVLAMLGGIVVLRVLTPLPNHATAATATEMQSK